MNLRKKLQLYLSNHFYGGIDPSTNPELTKQIIVSNFFSTFGYSITFIIGLTSLFSKQWMHATILLCTSALFYLSYRLHRIKLFKSPYVIAENIMLITLIILMLYLVYFGGVANTGPLWIYIIPPVTLFFGGIQKGLIIISIFTALICLMLFSPNDAFVGTTYAFEFKTRLIYSFATVASLFTAYEHIRGKAYSDLELLKQKFEQQAKHDMLSGLLNRRGMIESLQYEFKRNKRTQSDLSVMMCDIDNFKDVNDSYGHEKGDEIIKTLAHTLQNSLREQDVMSRWGGEEYLFLLPMTNRNQALVLAEKLRKKVEATIFEHNNNAFSVTISLGIYQFKHNDSINDMINQSDNKLYEAKAKGRNCCAI